MLMRPIAGVDVVAGFLVNMQTFARAPDLLARNPYLMASFRTFWSALLPAPVPSAAYLVSAAAGIGTAAWGWRRTQSPVTRIGLMALAIALAAPTCTSTTSSSWRPPSLPRPAS